MADVSIHLPAGPVAVFVHGLDNDYPFITIDIGDAVSLFIGGHARKCAVAARELAAALIEGADQLERALPPEAVQEAVPAEPATDDVAIPPPAPPSATLLDDEVVF